MTLKIADFHAWTLQVVNFAVITAWPGLGHLPPHGWRGRPYKLCLTHLHIFVVATKLSRGDLTFNFGGLLPSHCMIGAKQTIATTKVLLMGRCVRQSL